MNSFTSSGFTNFMKMAIEQAKIAQSAGEVPVGAVLLGPAGDVLAKSGNRTRELKDPSAHAEVLVIREACQVLGNERLIGCEFICYFGTLCYVRCLNFSFSNSPALLWCE